MHARLGREGGETHFLRQFGLLNDDPDCGSDVMLGLYEE